MPRMMQTMYQTMAMSMTPMTIHMLIRIWTIRMLKVHMMTHIIRQRALTTTLLEKVRIRTHRMTNFPKAQGAQMGMALPAKQLPVRLQVQAYHQVLCLDLHRDC
ncbi:Uncharacterised protein [Chlamydia trachomatis]|nr:Uncharacterised protein [Chlamydia trachomatis]